MSYRVAVRALCEFTAKAGDLDLRFTPSPTAQQGIAGHRTVAARRHAQYQAELSLEGVDMAEYSEQIDALGADFVKTQGIEDERLVRTDASIAISENAAQDGSASLTARVSAGQINMIVAETDIFAEVNDRGDITKPAEVMSAADLEQVKDALVDAKGNPVSDVNDAVGFDLSHSKTWTSMKGLPKEGVILGFSNITESKDMPIQFVEYLQFE